MSRVTLISRGNARSQSERESIGAQSVPGLVRSVRVPGSPAEVLSNLMEPVNEHSRSIV